MDGERLDLAGYDLVPFDGERRGRGGAVLLVLAGIAVLAITCIVLAWVVIGGGVLSIAPVVVVIRSIKLIKLLRA